jgi:hypothetical protein
VLRAADGARTVGVDEPRVAIVRVVARQAFHARVVNPQRRQAPRAAARLRTTPRRRSAPVAASGGGARRRWSESETMKL